MKVKTAVVRANREGLKKKLAAYGLDDLASSAKVRSMPGMHGCIAIQHAQLSSMSDEEIFELCRFAAIPLEFVSQAPPIP